MPAWRRRRARDAEEVEDWLDSAEDALDDDDPKRSLALANDAMAAARDLGADELVVLALTTRAAALIELGRFDAAATSATEACNRDPGMAAAHHELGTALYRLGRFAEAAGAFDGACRLEPTAAEPWHAAARCAVWLDELDRARDAFRRAAEIDPDEYVVPVRIAAPEFDRLSADALGSIPHQFRELLDNTIVTAQTLPDVDDVEQGFDPDTLGVYEGSTVLHTGDGPERIVLFQRNHENVCATLGELREEIRRTILHEVGHHFGMDEAELPY